MKSARLKYKSFSSRIILLVPAILVIFCVGSANSASEPGAITIVIEEEPRNLDPCQTSAPTAKVVIRNIAEALVEINATDGSITPRLAHSWKQIDANTWHFFLRKGVKFHDGEDFNAEAVIFNIKRLYDKRLDNRIRGIYFSNLKMEGKALDSHTLEIKTDRFEPLMLTLMGRLKICSPNSPLDKLLRNPMGTGPYKLVRWDAGTQIVLEHFDGYWGKQPQVKKAVYVWRTESSIRAAMVLIGEADLTPSISLQDANRPDMDISYLNSETSGLRIGGVWEAPLNDRRVRMALNYAIDRGAIRGSVLSKDVIPASQMVLPSTLGYNPDLKVWPYDPQKARQLLDEARKDGVPVDKEIFMVVRAGFIPGGQELGEAMMTMYRAVGLNVKMKNIDSGGYVSYRNKPFTTSGGPYLLQMQHDNGTGDPLFTVFGMYHCKGHTSNMCNKQVDDLIEKAQVATGEERKTFWRAAFQAVAENVPDVLLFHMVGYARVGKRINFKPGLETTGQMPLEEITFK